MRVPSATLRLGTFSNGKKAPDPARLNERDFRKRRALQGRRVREIDRRAEIIDPVSGAESTVRIWEMHPPA